MNFEQQKLNLLSNIRQLRSLAEDVGPSPICPKIDAEIQKLTEERFHLVALGQFKRGKTTLINAILGESLLPVAVVPLTSVLTLIRYGQEIFVEVVFQDHKRLTIHTSDLEDYVTERGNPKNEKHVRYVEIHYPSGFLHGGIILIDTPGIGSLFLHNTATTYDFIPDIDAAIFLLSADLPMTQAEYQFLEEVRNYVDKIFFVLNKIDILTPEELTEAVEYNTGVLQKQIDNNEIALFPLSARSVLEVGNPNDSRKPILDKLAEFKNALKSFLENERRSVLLRASQQRVRTHATELRFILELELKSNEMPLEDLRQKIDMFKNQIVSVQKDRKRFSYILTGELTSLEQWINEEIEKFKRLETDRLKEQISAWVAQQENTVGRSFIDQSKHKLSEMLISDFDFWRQAFEPKLITKYEKIAAEFTSEINGLIDDLHQISGKLFDIVIESFTDIETFTWKKTFTYSVEDGALFLEIEPMKLLAGALSKKMLKNKVQKKVIKEIEEKVERNCGRLRYEYSYSLQESARKFRADLEAEVEHIIESIESILRQAVQRKQENEQELRSQINLVRDRLKKLKILEQEFSIAL